MTTNLDRAFDQLAQLTPERIAEIRAKVRALPPPYARTRALAPGAPAVHIDVRCLVYPLDNGPSFLGGPECRALVMLYGPARFPWHVVRRLFVEHALPALEAKGDSLSTTVVEWLLGLMGENEVLFAQGGEPGPWHRVPEGEFIFDVGLHVPPAKGGAQ